MYMQVVFHSKNNINDIGIKNPYFIKIVSKVLNFLFFNLYVKIVPVETPWIKINDATIINKLNLFLNEALKIIARDKYIAKWFIFDFPAKIYASKAMTTASHITKLLKNKTKNTINAKVRF